MKALALSLPLLAVLSVDATAQTCASPGSDIVGWWDGDATGGTVAGDIANGNDLSSSSAVVTTAGLIGDALSFNATDARTLASAGPIVETTGAWTIEGWVRVGVGSAGQIKTFISEVGTTTGPVEGQFALRYLGSIGGVVQVLRKTGSGDGCITLPSIQALPIGVWTHVAATFGATNAGNNADLRLYVNGVRSTSGTFSSSFAPPQVSALRLGATGPGDSVFDGALDEFTVYRRALDDAEIQAGFLASFAGRCKSESALASDADFWWSADQNCNGYILDNTGGSAMEARNGASTGSGIIGDGFVLDGNDDHFGAGRPLVATQGPMTVEAWFRPDVGHTGAIVSELGAPGPGGLEGQFSLRTISGDRVQFLRTDGLTNCGGGSKTCVDLDAAPYTPGEWNHVVAIWDGTEILLYVNGALQPNASGRSHITQTNPLETQIGFYGNQLPFDGRIDDVAIYRRVLTAAEVASHYSAGRWGKVETAANQFHCAQGTQTDLVLTSAVNGVGAAGTPQKHLNAGDFLDVLLSSPGGAAVGDIPVVAMNLFPEGPGPGPDGQFPQLYIDRPSMTVLFNGLVSGPLGFSVLSNAGLGLGYVIPPGLEGMAIRIQGVSLSSGIRISEAHDFEVRF